jgi:hypothetical protein
MVLYVDNTNILVIDKNSKLLQGKTDTVKTQLQTWFSENNLIINTEKTKVMFFFSIQI